MASPELQQILDMMKAAPPRPENPTIEQQRAGMEAFARPVAGDVVCDPVDVDGIPGEWVSIAGTDPQRTILYLHGGGYVLGSIKSHRELVSRIARAAAARALLIDYRLGPENVFPAAVDDAVAAYRWLRAQGVPASEIVIA